MKTLTVPLLTALAALSTLSSALYIPDNEQLAGELSPPSAPDALGEELHRREALPPQPPPPPPPPPRPSPEEVYDDGPASTTPQNVAHNEPDALYWYGWPEENFEGPYAGAGSYFPDICYPMTHPTLVDNLKSARTYGPEIFVDLFLEERCDDVDPNADFLHVDAYGWGDLSGAPMYHSFKMRGPAPPPEAVIS